MKNPYIIPAAMICAAILAGFWMLKSPSEPQKVIVVQKPDISIHKAAKDGNIKAIKQHLAAGADVNAKDKNGKTPLDWAIEFKETEIAELIRKHGGKTKKELEAAGN